MKIFNRYLGVCLLISEVCLAYESPVYNPQDERIEIPFKIHWSKSSINETNIKNPEGLLYTTEIKVGSNDQTFEVLLDDSSSDTWIPDADCNLDACQGKSRFFKRDSKTFKAGKNFNLQYERYMRPELSVNGTVGYDTMLIASIKAGQQAFGIGQNITNTFNAMPFDGVLGLGFRSYSNILSASWLETIRNQGLISKSQYSIHLSDTVGKSSGKLIIGEPVPDFYTGKIHWYSLIRTDTAPAEEQIGYNISFHDISLENASVISSCSYHEQGCAARIDINTPVIVGPREDIDKIFSQIDLSQYCSGVDVSQPKIKITIDAQEYDITAQDYILRTGSGDTDCTLMLSYWDGDEKNWIFGAPVLKALYTIFDQTDMRIGLAKSKK